MNDITQEQSQHLEGFTVQRDKLVADISERTALRDSLVKQGFDAATSLSQINKEIEEKRGSIAAIEAEKKDALASLKLETSVAKKELDATNEKTDEAKKALKVLLELLQETSSVASSTLSDAIATKEEMTKLKKEVYDAVNTITASSSEVTRVIGHMSNDYQEYHNKIVGHEVDNEQRRLNLDKRETDLNVRETALNDTYGEIMAFMKSEGVTVVNVKEAQ